MSALVAFISKNERSNVICIPMLRMSTKFTMLFPDFIWAFSFFVSDFTSISAYNWFIEVFEDSCISPLLIFHWFLCLRLITLILIWRDYCKQRVKKCKWINIMVEMLWFRFRYEEETVPASSSDIVPTSPSPSFKSALLPSCFNLKAISALGVWL